VRLDSKVDSANLNKVAFSIHSCTQTFSHEMANVGGFNFPGKWALCEERTNVETDNWTWNCW